MSDATMGVRPEGINDLVKAAMEGAATRVKIASESERVNAASEGRPAASPGGKTKTASVSSEHVDLLVKAAGEISTELRKAASGRPIGGGLGPGVGPGALPVTSTAASTSMPHDPGKAHAGATPPVSTPMHASHSAAVTQVQNDENNPAGKGSVGERLKKAADDGKCPRCGDKDGKDCKCGEKEKKAGAPLYLLSLVDGPKTAAAASPAAAGTAPLSLIHSIAKQAEDAINPAHISAGAAVPPDTSASGQPGGQPVAGPPQGATSLISSNQAAIDYTRGQAKAPEKAQMAGRLTEPMQSSAHDHILQQAFNATGQAGVKISSEQPATSDEVMRVAAGRALLSKLASAGK